VLVSTLLGTGPVSPDPVSGGSELEALIIGIT